MSKELIDFIFNDENTKAEDEFENLMADKGGVLIDKRKREIANKIFKFQSKGLSYVYSDSGTFTLRSGVSLEAQNPQIFTF